MTTMEATMNSLTNFHSYLSTLVDEKMVELDNEKQVTFFLSFLGLFKIDKKNVTVYSLYGVTVDFDVEPDYENNVNRCIVTGEHVKEGFVIVLGDHADIESEFGYDHCGLEDVTANFTF